MGPPHALLLLGPLHLAGSSLHGFRASANLRQPAPRVAGPSVHWGLDMIRGIHVSSRGQLRSGRGASRCSDPPAPTGHGSGRGLGPSRDPPKPRPSLRRGPRHGHERPKSRYPQRHADHQSVRRTSGRIVVDEPTSLPEGEIVELVPMAELLARGGDDLDDEERAELHAALDEAEADIAAGRVVSEEEVWATLRANK
jgi:hypothetical protein